MDSSDWQKLENKDVILRTWEVESAHNYDNNQHVTQVGAARLTLSRLEYTPGTRGVRPRIKKFG